MFGSEQKFIQSRSFLRLVYMLLGEFRYPIRHRAILLYQALPRNIFPEIIWDAGCGEGQTSFWLSKHFPKSKLIGTDIRQENIERCKKIAESMKKDNTSFFKKDLLESIPQKVNLIVCSEVLEHIESYRDVLINFSTALAIEGHLVIHTPADTFFQSPTWGLRKIMQSKELESASSEKGQYHVRSGFVLDDLAQEIEDLGFDVLEKRYTFGPIAMFAHTIYEWTRSRSKAWQIVTLYPLLLMGYLDMLFPASVGAGILITAKKNSLPA